MPTGERTTLAREPAWALVNALDRVAHRCRPVPATDPAVTGLGTLPAAQALTERLRQLTGEADRAEAELGEGVAGTATRLRRATADLLAVDREVAGPDGAR